MSVDTLDKLIKELDVLFHHSPNISPPRNAITEAAHLDEKINKFTEAVHEFEKLRKEKIKTSLQKLDQSKQSIQQQLGIADTGRYLHLLHSALDGILNSDTIDQVEAFRSSFNYLIDTAHPENVLLPLNHYLEKLHMLVDLEAERFTAAKNPQWQTMLSSARKNAEIQKQLCDNAVDQLLAELATARLQEKLIVIEKIKTLKNEINVLHQLTTVDIPATQSFDDFEKLHKLFRQHTDTIHHIAAINEPLVTEFLVEKNNCHKLVNELCTVRSSYLQSEAEHESEVMREFAWEALLAATAVPGVPGSNRIARVINTAISSQYFNAASVGLAGADIAFTGSEIVEKPNLGEQTKVDETATKKSTFNQWLGFGLSVLGLTAGIILTFIPFTAPLGIAATAISFAGMAWSIKEIKERYQEERARDHLIQQQLDNHQAELDHYIKSKNTLRQERIDQDNLLSTEAKIDLLLMGHKTGDKLSVAEKQMLKTDVEKIKTENALSQQAKITPKPEGNKKLDDKSNSDTNSISEDNHPHLQD